MALTDENGGIPATMLVGPTGYGGGYGNGMGFGSDWAWIILLLLIGGGGWGWGGGMGGNMMLGYDFPWLLNGQNAINANTNAGFQNAMLNDGITSIRDGIAGISTQLCNGFSGTQMALANGFAGVEQGANTRQMANMQTMFGLQSQFADCCCENRLASCQTQNIIQNEGNATRFADATNTRDIIQSQTNGTQAILDKLCQLELDNYKTQLDAKNDLIAQLRQENLYARGQASQDVQTAELRANNATVANQLLAEMRSCPIPAQPVYGSQPIFTCGGNGCGCGCNG